MHLLSPEVKATGDAWALPQWRGREEVSRKEGVRDGEGGGSPNPWLSNCWQLKDPPPPKACLAQAPLLAAASHSFSWPRKPSAL